MDLARIFPISPSGMSVDPGISDSSSGVSLGGSSGVTTQPARRRIVTAVKLAQVRDLPFLGMDVIFGFTFSELSED